jgi:hypothetical protein
VGQEGCWNLCMACHARTLGLLHAQHVYMKLHVKVELNALTYRGCDGRQVLNIGDINWPQGDWASRLATEVIYFLIDWCSGIRHVDGDSA